MNPVEYLTENDRITPDMISGLFVGWPAPPAPETPIEVMAHYAIDLCCDPDLLPYYAKLGFLTYGGAGLRFPEALRG